MPIEDICQNPRPCFGLVQGGQRACTTGDYDNRPCAQRSRAFCANCGQEGSTRYNGKGFRQIHINMGTMLSFVTSDCNITSELLDEALKESVLDSYNAVSVDGDTSTNDTLFILANGLADNPCIDKKNEDYYVFLEALKAINIEMAKAIASDGEGATHMLECELRGASDKESARNLAKSVISSSLVKAAFFGRDANWGRILCALGYSGSLFSPEK